VDLDRTLKVIEANRDLIRGIKVRASQIITGDLGVECVRLAKCVTSAPRKLLGEPVEDDWLAPGQPADFTAFRIELVECQTFDSLGAELQLREFILPQLAVLGTEWRRCESRG
jgi:predicted amidohydrolase